MSNLYSNTWIGYSYDLLASLIWLPSKSKLYDQCVLLSGIGENDTVLELGCGTGFLTQKLIEIKARVTSVDQSAGMLAGARKRVPLGNFVQSDIIHYTDTKKYDYVVLFFVLHELNGGDRKAILKSAKTFLTKTGKIIICDFSIPDSGIMKMLFPKLIRLWEPQHTIDVLKNGFRAEIESNTLAVRSLMKLHQGRVQLITLTPL